MIGLPLPLLLPFGYICSFTEDVAVSEKTPFIDIVALAADVPNGDTGVPVSNVVVFVELNTLMVIRVLPPPTTVVTAETE